MLTGCCFWIVPFFLFLFFFFFSTKRLVSSLQGLRNMVRWFQGILVHPHIGRIVGELGLMVDERVTGAVASSLESFGMAGERSSTTTKSQRRRLGKQQLSKIEEKLMAAALPSLESESDHEDQPLLRILWDKIPAAVNPAAGELEGDRADRKREQIENLYWAVRSLVKPGDCVVDFCSGGVSSFCFLFLSLLCLMMFRPRAMWVLSWRTCFPTSKW